MKKRFKRLQDDLRAGMTIEDALHKHNMSFKEAFDGMPKPLTNGGNTGVGEKFISKHQGKYIIRKRHRNKTRLFGTYDRLEDAIKVRDYCLEHGWYITKLDDYCKAVDVERCTR